MLSKAVSSLALLALAACGGLKEPYVVGAAGPWKQGYGLQNLQGVQLAAEEINKAGGINGHPFQVVTRDDEGDGTVAAKVAQEFVRNRKISVVIGHVNSSGMLSAARVYDGELAAVATSATSPISPAYRAGSSGSSRATPSMESRSPRSRTSSLPATQQLPRPFSTRTTRMVVDWLTRSGAPFTGSW